MANKGQERAAAERAERVFQDAPDEQPLQFFFSKQED